MMPATIQAMPLPAVDRKFWAILIFSAALHGALLLSLAPQGQQQPITLPPITASIRLINIIESGPPAKAAVPNSAVPEKARPKPPLTEQAARPLVKMAGPVPRTPGIPVPTSRSPAIRPGAITPTPSAAVEPFPAPAEVLSSSAAPAPAADRSTSLASATPAGESASRETLERYRQRLTELFAGRHEYPRVAALRGWEGEVRLRLKVARQGNLLGVHLDRSSGFDVLDQHAMAMIEAFGTLPPLPESLGSSEIQLVVPINYKLRKTT